MLPGLQKLALSGQESAQTDMYKRQVPGSDDSHFEIAIQRLALHKQNGGVDLHLYNDKAGQTIMVLKRIQQFWSHTQDIPHIAKLLGFKFDSQNLYYTRPLNSQPTIPERTVELWRQPFQTNHRLQPKVTMIVDMREAFRSALTPSVFSLLMVRNTFMESVFKERLRRALANVVNNLPRTKARRVISHDAFLLHGPLFNTFQQNALGPDFAIFQSAVRFGRSASGDGVTLLSAGIDPMAMAKSADLRAFFKSFRFQYDPNSSHVSPSDLSHYMKWHRPKPADETFDFASDVFLHELESKIATEADKLSLWNAEDTQAVVVTEVRQWAEEEQARRVAEKERMEREWQEREAKEAEERERRERENRERQEREAEARRQKRKLDSAQRLFDALNNGTDPSDEDIEFAKGEWGENYWFHVVESVAKPQMARATARSEAMQEGLQDPDLANIFTKFVGVIGVGIRKVNDVYRDMGYSDAKDGYKEKTIKFEYTGNTPFGHVRFFLRTQPSDPSGRVHWTFQAFPGTNRSDSRLNVAITNRMMNVLNYKQGQVRDVGTLIAAVNALWLDLSPGRREEIRAAVIAADVTIGLVEFN
jgi:hypothetical protein